METLDKWFAYYSTPNYCRADGGEFRTTFDQFLKERGIIREQGSSYNLPSQGLVERNLRTLKKMMRKMALRREPWQMAAGELNRAPRSSRPSPAQMFFQRFCRSPVLPELPKVVTKEEVNQAVVARDESRLDMAVSNVSKKEQTPLVVGQEVKLLDPITKVWDREGVVKAVRPSGRSYLIHEH